MNPPLFGASTGCVAAKAGCPLFRPPLGSKPSGGLSSTDSTKISFSRGSTELAPESRGQVLEPAPEYLTADSKAG